MTNLRLPQRFHRSRDALAPCVQPEQSNRRRRRERQHRQSRRSSRRLGNVVADDLSPPRRRPRSVGCPRSSSSSPVTAPALERPIAPSPPSPSLPLSLSVSIASNHARNSSPRASAPASPPRARDRSPPALPARSPPRARVPPARTTTRDTSSSSLSLDRRRAWRSLVNRLIDPSPSDDAHSIHPARRHR